MDIIPESVVSVKHPETLVYIFNMSEDVWPFIAAITDKKARQLEIQENTYLADLRLFLFANEEAQVLFLCPRNVSPEYLEYFQQIVGRKSLTILPTQYHSGVICEDILNDDRIMAALIDAANSSRRLTITSYATSPQFLKLMQALRERGITVYTPEAPEEDDAWTVNFFGSKSGIRQLSQQSSSVEPDFQMAGGVVCFGIDDAAKIAARRYIKNNGVVLKTNKGHAGMGVVIFREGDLPMEYRECVKAILSLFQKESYWSRFPIIIEELIFINQTIGGGYPNVEYKILKTGKIELLYYGGMRMSKEGVYKGMEIHNDAISDQITARVVDTGFYIAEQFASSGYRGYFDVDFVAGKNGKLYVTESNVRSTGGTFVHTLAQRYYGKDYMYAAYILSNNSYDVAHLKNPSFKSVKTLLTPILFDRETKEGLVIISENMFLLDKLAYIIFGKTKKKALEIEQRMEELLK
ncbi:MAG: hypothetical protein AAB508_06695 [Patescibacteria group bacterium]